MLMGDGDENRRRTAALRSRTGRESGSVTTEPLMLLADLLYALGWALWTGVILVMFVQIWPEAKMRQYKQALDAYEAAVGRQARVGSGRAPDSANGEDA
jgi:hypothetical protein